MSSAEDTFFMICIEIEEASQKKGVLVEDIATVLIEQLIRMGDDLLEHLDPPVGLQRWLNSHGLSLVATKEASPPKVWEIIEDEEEDQAPSMGERVVPAPLPQSLVVGDYIEYSTAASGPRGQSQIGAGRVVGVEEDVVKVGYGDTTLYLYPETDFIRVIRSDGP